MKEFTIKRNAITDPVEIWQYSQWNPGYIPTGDVITINGTDRYGLPFSESLVIFKAADRKHDWTPYGMARQTSKYIIIARYDRYYKLTLNGKVVSLDAVDSNCNH